MVGGKERGCVAAVRSGVQVLGAYVGVVEFGCNSPDSHDAVAICLPQGVESDVKGSASCTHVWLGGEVFSGLTVGVQKVRLSHFVSIELQHSINVISCCVAAI